MIPDDCASLPYSEIGRCVCSVSLILSMSQGPQFQLSSRRSHFDRSRGSPLTSLLTTFLCSCLTAKPLQSRESCGPLGSPEPWPWFCNIILPILLLPEHSLAKGLIHHFTTVATDTRQRGGSDQVPDPERPVSQPQVPAHSFAATKPSLPSSKQSALHCFPPSPAGCQSGRQQGVEGSSTPR